jgi:hypothetical protein
MIPAVRLEIGGDKRLVIVSEDALHQFLRLGLDDGADLFVGGGFSILGTRKAIPVSFDKYLQSSRPRPASGT